MVKADDSDEQVLAPGDSLSFLDYFDLNFDLERDYEYNEFTLSLDEITSDDIEVVKIVSESDEGIELGNGERLYEVYFDGETFYYKEDGDWIMFNGTGKLVNEDIELELSYDGEGLFIGDDIYLVTDFTKFGNEERDAESSELFIYGDEKGSEDNSYLLFNGVVLDNIESNLERDELVLNVPDREPTGILRILKR
jgi:hypothetical protein